MTTLIEYHDFYVTTDVLLLPDCFEAFRQAMVRANGLDCLHFPSLPSLFFSDGPENDPSRTRLDRRPGHVPHDRVGDQVRAQLRESKVRRSQPPHAAQLPTGRADFLPMLSGRELSIRHVPVIQSSSLISDSIRYRCST